MQVHSFSSLVGLFSTSNKNQLFFQNSEDIKMRGLGFNYSTTVIEKIKEMSRSFFYEIPSYDTMGYEKWYTPLIVAQCEENCAFEI